MGIYIYTPDLELAGVIDTITSLIWHRVYYTAGDFEIHAPANEITLTLLQKKNLVTKDGSAEFGILEDVTIEQTEEGEFIKAVGRFGLSLLARRIIFERTTLSDTVENAMRILVDQNVIHPTLTDRTIPNIVLGSLNGFPETVSFQVTYRNLMIVLQGLSETSGIASQIRFDASAKSLLFETYRGLDRSINQSINSRVIFSNDYDNLKASLYQASDTQYTNVALVGGEGEGTDRKLVIVGSGAGENRYEVFVNAKEIRMEDDITEPQYYDLLAQKGAESLIPQTEYFEGDVLIDGNVIYKVDYDLGDIVTIENSRWGKRINVRINEITEVSDENGETVIPVFGQALPTLSDVASQSDVSEASTGGTVTVTPNKAVVSNAAGNLLASATTDVEIGYISGLTSNLQAQLDGKSPKVSPAFTGTPTAPTAATAASTAQLATTAFVQNAIIAQMINFLKTVYPIGSFYHNASDPTSPATLFGFGIWVQVKGRMVIGQDSSNASFDVLGEIGGEATHILSTSEMPTHSHIQDAHNHAQDPHAHTFVIPPQWATNKGTSSVINISDTPNAAGGVTRVTGNTTATNQAATATNQSSGGGMAHNNLPPYMVGMMWYRTA